MRGDDQDAPEGRAHPGGASGAQMALPAERHSANRGHAMTKREKDLMSRAKALRKDLLPCPFCGRGAVIEPGREAGENKPEKGFYVECTGDGCAVVGEIVTVCDLTGEVETLGVFETPEAMCLVVKVGHVLNIVL